MGAEAYSYETEYSEDLNAVFEKLKAEVFSSGNFRFSEMNPSSIQEAQMNAEEEGTASILDLVGVSEHHQIGFMSPLSPDEYKSYFGSLTPSLAVVEDSMKFWDSIGRVEARAVVIFEDEIPAQLFVAGYSAD